MPETPSRRLPLDGVRVIELGQLLAGPFTGTLLAYFGADVVKVEPPGGDPIRGWRKLDEDGTSYWWRSLGRNKKSVTLDLKSEQGKGLVRKLMSSADVVIENFRPGTMENWGLVLFAPRTIMLDAAADDEAKWLVINVISHELAHQVIC